MNGKFKSKLSFLLNYCNHIVVYYLTQIHFCILRRNKEQRLRVTNKARVEGSIVEATIVKEISTTSRCYFEDLTIKDPKGNEKCNTSRGFLSIFDKTGHHIGRENRRTLTDDEYKAAHTYVLLNCPEICDKYLGYNIIIYHFHYLLIYKRC